LSVTTKGKSSVSGNKKATKDTSPQKRAIQSRWDGRAKTDEEVREYYLNADHGEGLAALQTLRKHVEIAARAYDENIHRGAGEVCANPTCKRQLGPHFPPYNKMPVKDPDTQQVRNIFTCCQACYVAVHGKSGNPQERRG
jgi:hypothetical protein